MAPVSLQDVIALASRNGRVCPQPSSWRRLYDLLPNTRRQGHGFVPAVPLILAPWWKGTDEQKAERLREHLEWASRHGVLDRVGKYLAGLPEQEWHHSA